MARFSAVTIFWVIWKDETDEESQQESKREQLKNKDDEEKPSVFTAEAPKAPVRRPGSVRAKIDILVDDDDE